MVATRSRARQKANRTSSRASQSQRISESESQASEMVNILDFGSINYEDTPIDVVATHISSSMTNGNIQSSLQQGSHAVIQTELSSTSTSSASPLVIRLARPIRPSSNRTASSAALDSNDTLDASDTSPVTTSVQNVQAARVQAIAAEGELSYMDYDSRVVRSLPSGQVERECPRPGHIYCGPPRLLNNSCIIPSRMARRCETVWRMGLPYLVGTNMRLSGYTGRDAVDLIRQRQDITWNAVYSFDFEEGEVGVNTFNGVTADDIFRLHFEAVWKGGVSRFSDMNFMMRDDGNDSRLYNHIRGCGFRFGDHYWGPLNSQTCILQLTGTLEDEAFTRRFLKSLNGLSDRDIRIRDPKLRARLNNLILMTNISLHRLSTSSLNRSLNYLSSDLHSQLIIQRSAVFESWFRSRQSTDSITQYIGPPLFFNTIRGGMPYSLCIPIDIPIVDWRENALVAQYFFLFPDNDDLKPNSTKPVKTNRLADCNDPVASGYWPIPTGHAFPMYIRRLCITLDFSSSIFLTTRPPVHEYDPPAGVSASNNHLVDFADQLRTDTTEARYYSGSAFLRIWNPTVFSRLPILVRLAAVPRNPLAPRVLAKGFPNDSANRRAALNSLGPMDPNRPPTTAAVQAVPRAPFPMVLQNHRVPSFPGANLLLRNSGASSPMTTTSSGSSNLVKKNKQQIIASMKAIYNRPGDDMAVDRLMVSLRCPILFVRIQTPVRLSVCKHMQCFDHSALSAIWSSSEGVYKCPTCSKLSAFVIEDGLFADILRTADSNVEDVLIDTSTGQWHSCSDSTLFTEDSPLFESSDRVAVKSEIWDTDGTPRSFASGTSLQDAIILD